MILGQNLLGLAFWNNLLLQKSNGIIIMGDRAFWFYCPAPEP